MTQHLPKVSPSNMSSPWGLGFQHRNSGMRGATHIQTTAPLFSHLGPFVLLLGRPLFLYPVLECPCPRRSSYVLFASHSTHSFLSRGFSEYLYSNGSQIFLWPQLPIRGVYLVTPQAPAYSRLEAPSSGPSPGERHHCPPSHSSPWGLTPQIP